MNRPHEKNRESDWRKVGSAEKLQAKGKLKVRVNGRQIVIFDTASGLRACDNQCPHEGYPLSEGTVAGECTLTCNWHNWKFNLEDGSNLFGGDRLRVYPVRVEGSDLWLDISDPPFNQQYAEIIENLEDAFRDAEYDRIAREIARLTLIGADPLDSVRHAIRWSFEKMEFGWTHAYAGMADWLALYDELEHDQEARLVCLVESVFHAADDVLREADFPYPSHIKPFVESAFLDAIEREDEHTAIALINGAMDAEMTVDSLDGVLSAAALTHYNDFGHSLIYVSKIRELTSRLGESVAPPLLRSLVRSIVYATREDRIPEFREYSLSVSRWGQAEPEHRDEISATDLHGKSIRESLRTTVSASDQPVDVLYRALLVANATNMLRFDVAQQYKTHVTVSGNVNWLDFTHGITFANAVRIQCGRHPHLWPNGLLQMACFNGRNATFTDDGIDSLEWMPANPAHLLDTIREIVLNHDCDQPIVSVHLLKTFMAVRDECELLEATDSSVLLGALNRFFNTPLKRKQPRRTAYQSMKFVTQQQD
ncbi:MAG: Rieske 2Fe-2S domain-containing protein [Pseudomonadota bacterium]